MVKKETLRGIGWTVIVGTHVYMLFAGLPENQMIAHALLNLGATALLWFNWK